MKLKYNVIHMGLGYIEDCEQVLKNHINCRGVAYTKSDGVVSKTKSDIAIKPSRCLDQKTKTGTYNREKM